MMHLRPEVPSPSWKPHAQTAKKAITKRLVACGRRVLGTSLCLRHLPKKEEASSNKIKAHRYSARETRGAGLQHLTERGTAGERSVPPNSDPGPGYACFTFTHCKAAPSSRGNMCCTLGLCGLV